MPSVGPMRQWDRGKNPLLRFFLPASSDVVDLARPSADGREAAHSRQLRQASHADGAPVAAAGVDDGGGA
jgi:hypothetical protein